MLWSSSRWSLLTFCDTCVLHSVWMACQSLIFYLFWFSTWGHSRHLSWSIKTLLCCHFKMLWLAVSCCLDTYGWFAQSRLLGEKAVSCPSITKHPYDHKCACVFGCFSSLLRLGIWGQGVMGFAVSLPSAESPCGKFVWGLECPWLEF